LLSYFFIAYFQKKYLEELVDYFKNENKKIDNSFNKTLELLENKNKYLKHELKYFSDSFGEVVLYTKTNLFGKITEVSKAFCNVNGYSPDELLKKSHNIVRHPETPKEFFKEMWDIIEKNETYVGIIKNKRKDGTSYIVKIIIKPTFDNEGVKNGYFSIKHVLVENADDVPLLPFIEEYEKSMNEKKLLEKKENK
jgi:PAS domain S-box-containing protein